jgi:hypothetical protein
MREQNIGLPAGIAPDVGVDARGIDIEFELDGVERWRRQGSRSATMRTAS